MSARRRFSKAESIARREHYDSFAKRFGRAPQKGDPVYWDHDEQTPVPAGPHTRDREAVARTMERCGDAAVAYIFRKTGLIRQGGVRLSAEQAAELTTAEGEYRTQQAALVNVAATLNVLTSKFDTEGLRTAFTAKDDQDPAEPL
jgi:hypothetical protein